MSIHKEEAVLSEIITLFYLFGYISPCSLEQQYIFFKMVEHRFFFNGHAEHTDFLSSFLFELEMY